MKCEEAREFASALCDGETIPRSAAEHIGRCEVCRARLKEFTEIGAELRRVASLETVEQVKVRDWQGIREATVWWRKGWETVRVPRFVFALLLVVVVALGSDLLIMRTRAQGQSQGAMLVLTTTLPDGHTMMCGLLLNSSKAAPCEAMEKEFAYALRVIAKDGNRVELGARIRTNVFWSAPVVPMDSLFKGVEEHQYWLELGQELKIPSSGSGALVVTGSLLDRNQQ